MRSRDRQRSTRQKNVIVFGAGASAAEGAPTQGSLFDDYFGLNFSTHRIERIADMDKELREFFSSFFGIQGACTAREKKRYPTFEEALGIVELALQRAECFQGYPSTPGQPRLQRIREYLILLIAVLLKQKLEYREPVHHRALLRSLHNSDDLADTTFISFNYELLLDHVLTEARRQYGLDLDYGIEFANYESQPAHPDFDWDRPRTGQSLSLLKLHGSLNWLYCPTCTVPTITPKDKGVTRLLEDPSKAKCRRCGTTAVAMIIPPTYYKVMESLHLRQIWWHAEQALIAADRIIFCGYSLPDADMHVKYLLKRAEVNRAKPAQIFIVNNCAKKKRGEKNDEERRYLRLFNNPRCVMYTSLTFQDFAERGFEALPPQ
jgi:NAD-dependent SIR2 family protein deacetylase